MSRWRDGGPHWLSRREYAFTVSCTSESGRCGTSARHGCVTTKPHSTSRAAPRPNSMPLLFWPTPANHGVRRHGDCCKRSVLEHGYLVRVERPHGLPRAVRQKRAASSVGVCYRDTEYSERLVVELDGRVYHDSASRRDADFERDLDAAVDGRATVRLSYGQVFDRPCQTAGKIAQLLQRHGIAVRGRPCGPECGFSRLDRAA